MRHKASVYAPAGTPLPDRTVGEVVAERPSLARIFQVFGIDFCCHGGRTLREACAIKGVAIESVLEQLEAGYAEKEESETNPALLTPVELMKHIVGTYHAYLRKELPRLLAMSECVSMIHGGRTGSLKEVYWLYCEMVDDLTVHLNKEEQILFPAIEALYSGENAAMSLDDSVADMLAEHDDEGDTLAWIRILTNNFTAPPDACKIYRAFFAGLAELEEKLHRQIHLENSVLFPQVLAKSKAE